MHTGDNREIIVPNGAIYGGTITRYSVAKPGASSLYFNTHENIKIALDEAGITIPYP